MTEKRFTKYVPDSYGYTYITTIIDNEKNKQTGNTDEIVDMLNELAEENEQLKKDCSNLIDDNTEYVAEINQMHKENGELKKILGFLRNDNATDILNVLNSQENQIWKLKKENEKLKSEIKDLNDVLARYEEKELQE